MEVTKATKANTRANHQKMAAAKEQQRGKRQRKRRNNPHAGKQCHICKKYGHIAADCYWKVSEVREEPEPNPKPETDAMTVGSVRDYVAEPETDMIMTVHDTIAAIKPCENSDFAWFMVDSGACVTCATEGEFQLMKPKSKHCIQFKD